MSSRVIALLLLTATLGACGGGGSAAPQTYPLRASIDKLTRAGSAFRLTATGTAATSAADGDCSGTLDQVDSGAIYPANFESTPGWSSITTAVLAFTSTCSFSSGPSTDTASEVAYFDASYVPLGVGISGAALAAGNYGVYGSPQAFAATVAVGDRGTIGTVSFYADSTKPAVLSIAKRSYVIEADTATTAILNLISEAYDAGGTVLKSKAQTRYRIDPRGRLWVVSQEIEEYGATTTHLVFRCAQANCLVLDQ